MEEEKCREGEEADGLKQTVVTYRVAYGQEWAKQRNLEKLDAAIHKYGYGIRDECNAPPFFPESCSPRSLFCPRIDLTVPGRPSQAPSFPTNRPWGFVLLLPLFPPPFTSFPSLSLLEFSHPTREICSLYHVHLGKSVTLSTSHAIRSSHFLCTALYESARLACR